jgi:hypothetical protein
MTTEAAERTTTPDPIVDDLIQEAAEHFVELGFLASDGLLDLPIHLGGVRSIRLELGAGQVLQLQSLGIDAQGVDDIASVADIRVGSWADGYQDAFDKARLFDMVLPSGTIVRTRSGKPAWLEITFARPLTVTRVRVRNVADEAAQKTRGLKLAVRTRWRSRVIYDGASQLDRWVEQLGRARARAGSEEETLAILETLDMTVTGRYAKAHTFLAHHVADEARRHHFRARLNEALLPARGLEWTVHGPQRPFRNWTDEERVDYVRDSAEVVRALQSLTPNVCFGFGSVLSVVRDRALIPHDDDIDLVVGFETTEAANLDDALGLIEAHLRSRGYDVSGSFAAHRHVRRPGKKRVDVFVGIFEGEAIDWYPAARGKLTRELVFPPRAAELLGIPVSIPAQPEVYLERLYGEGWRVPDPYFSHPWNLSAYEDLRGARESMSS